MSKLPRRASGIPAVFLLVGDDVRSNISESEWQDFEAALCDAKRARADFDVSETVQPMQGTHIQPQRGTVAVTHIKSGVVRVYSTSFGNTWVADFIHDLQTNDFGNRH